MIAFIARKVGSTALLLVGISVLTYLLLALTSGDVARKILGEAAGPEQLELKRQELGLDQPLLVRLGSWLADGVRGDLGRSWFTGERVTAGIASRLEVTLTLMAVTIIVAVIISVVLGVLAARRGGIADAIVQGFAVIGIALPEFLVALALVSIFAIELGLLPSVGFVRIDQSLAGWARSIVLPVTALSIPIIASVAQQVRGGYLDTLQQDFVRTLRARGTREASITGHVLKNASGPALSVLSLKIVGLLGGAVVVEQVFSLGGLGQFAVQGTSRGDIPVVMGVVVVCAVIVAIINTAIDLLQAVLNPKVRTS